MFPNNPVLGKTGLVFLVIAVLIAAYTTYSIQGSVVTKGKVISVEKNYNGAGSNRTVSYLPTISFVDDHGDNHQAPTNYEASSYNYKIGTELDIYYDPEDYSNVRIASFGSLWRLPLVFSGLGLFIIWLATKKSIKSGNIIQDESEQITSSKDSLPENSKEEQLSNEALPKGFEIHYFDDYMHIIRKWFGVNTILIALSALIFNGVWFSNDFINLVVDDKRWMIKLFFLTFSIIGISLLYYTIASCFNKTHIYVSKDAIQIKHQPIPWLGNKRLETKNIKQLFVKEKISSSRNGSTSVKFHVLGLTSKDQQFSLLKGLQRRDQALFVEQKVERYLGIKNEKVSGELP